MKIVQLDRNAGKRLLHVSDPHVYLAGEFQDVQQRVYCAMCGRVYRLGERVVDGLGVVCCPSKKANVGCRGTLKSLIVIQSARHLMSLKRNAKPAFPF
jgi:uncharacterized protein YbaR (Trm112 family)